MTAPGSWPRRTIHAAYNRRYFDRRRGVTLLGTTADHYAGLHTIVITGTQPDAPYILDGLLDPQTSVRPGEIMTDTAGYTDVIFGLFRLLGYQYSPRLADAGGATFWRINPTDYGPLNALVVCPPPGQHAPGRAALRRPAARRWQPVAGPHHGQSARPGAAQPHPPPRLERLSPLGTEHITLTGRYRIALPELLRDRGAYRELNTTAAIAA